MSLESCDPQRIGHPTNPKPSPHLRKINERKEEEIDGEATCDSFIEQEYFDDTCFIGKYGDLLQCAVSRHLTGDHGESTREEEIPKGRERENNKRERKEKESE